MAGGRNIFLCYCGILLLNPFVLAIKATHKPQIDQIWSLCICVAKNCKVPFRQVSQFDDTKITSHDWWYEEITCHEILFSVVTSELTRSTKTNQGGHSNRIHIWVCEGRVWSGLGTLLPWCWFHSEKITGGWGSSSTSRIHRVSETNQRTVSWVCKALSLWQYYTTSGWAETVLLFLNNCYNVFLLHWGLFTVRVTSIIANAVGLWPALQVGCIQVTYRDIKIYLLMLERGFPLPVSPAPITDMQDITTPIDTAADELLEGTADALGSQKSDSKSEVLDQSPSGVFTTPPWLPQTGSDEMTLTGLRRRMPSWTSQEKTQTSETPAKKVKTSPTQAPDDGRVKVKADGGETATEEKLVQWLMTTNGVIDTLWPLLDTLSCSYGFSLSFFCLLFLLSFPTHLGFSLKAHSGQLLGGSCVGDKSCNFVPVSWNRWACPLGLIAETGRGFCHICQEWALQSNVKLGLSANVFVKNCIVVRWLVKLLCWPILCSALNWAAWMVRILLTFFD